MTYVKHQFGVLSFFGFGHDIDIEVVRVMDVANQARERVTATLDLSKRKVKFSLEKLDEMRDKLYQDSLGAFFDLYDRSLIGLEDIPPNTTQAERFNANAPIFAEIAQPRDSNSIRKKGGRAILFGILSALVVFQILGWINYQQPIAIAGIIGALLGLLIEMTFCYRFAKKNFAAAVRYSDQVTAYEERAIRFSSKAEQLVADYPVAMDILQRKAIGLNHQVEFLSNILTDATNAAMLLNKLINMPLIDGDGALLADVMEQLQTDAAASEEMQTLLVIEDRTFVTDKSVAENAELET